MKTICIILLVMTTCICALQMNFFLQVTFADGDIYSWHKVPLACACDVISQARLPNLAAWRHVPDALCASLQVRTAIQNIIMGQIYVEHTGVYRVYNHVTGLTAVMELVKPKQLVFSAKMRKAAQHVV